MTNLIPRQVILYKYLSAVQKYIYRPSEPRFPSRCILYIIYNLKFQYFIGIF